MGLTWSWMCLLSTFLDEVNTWLGRVTIADCFGSHGCASSKEWRAWTDIGRKVPLPGCLKWTLLIPGFSTWTNSSAVLVGSLRSLALQGLWTVAWSYLVLGFCAPVVMQSSFLYPYSMWVLVQLSMYACTVCIDIQWYMCLYWHCEHVHAVLVGFIPLESIKTQGNKAKIMGK